MQILNAEETARALPFQSLVPAIADAAGDLRAGLIRAPERIGVSLDTGVLLCMPAAAHDIAVTKLVTVHAGNAARGLPAIQGEVIVLDAATGQRLMLLDGPTVTGRRTAAVSLLGIQLLASAAPQSALLIGTGVQAASHADALVEFFGVTSLLVCGRRAGAGESFCAALLARHPHVSAHAVTRTELEATPAEVDVVVSTTNSTTPVVPANLHPHTLAVAVGSYTAEMAELPPALLHMRRVVVDDLAGARHEAGDLIQAGVNWDDVVDLGLLLSQPVIHGPSVFKTVGQAAWDLAAARVALSALK